MPMNCARKRSRVASGMPAVSCPATSTRPASTGVIPQTAFSSVVLPHPDGPHRATCSPAATRNWSTSNTGSSVPSGCR